MRSTPGALHIWPRGGFMLIALPNIGGSFTATLFLPRTGAASFGALATADAHPRVLRARICRCRRAHAGPRPRVRRTTPRDSLAPCTARPGTSPASVLLLGDAAHAIFPFHGQGMNAAFEDCLVFDDLLGGHADDWRACLTPSSGSGARTPRPSRRCLSRTMRRCARRCWIPPSSAIRSLRSNSRDASRTGSSARYSMVMFHPEISYAEALRRGELQADIIAAIDRNPERAAALIHEHLPPIRSRRTRYAARSSVRKVMA